MSPPPIVVNVLPEPKTAEQLLQERAEREAKGELDRKLVAFTADLADYTGGLFVATIVLAVATLALGLFAWRQSGDTKRLLASAEASATAAKKSAEVAENALRITQRAYISLGRFSVEGFEPGSTKRKQFKLEATNRGNTLATVTGRLLQATIQNELPEKPPYDDVAVGKVSIPIGPEDRQSHTTGLDGISATALERILSGETTFWMWGFLEYRDAFDVAHRSAFCVRYDPATSQLNLGGPEGYNYAT